MRASCMVFLPALSSARMIQRLIEEVGRYGVTIRGIYGEGTKALEIYIRFLIKNIREF